MLVKEQNLVENLCQRELDNPEGAGFDLRVDEVFIIEGGESYLGENERKTPRAGLIAKYEKDKDILLKPGDYVLVKTIEKVNQPANIGAIFRPRSTLQRSGIALFTAMSSPGYSGEFTFGMKNVGNNNFRLELGARIVHIIFFKTGENVSEYRGQWQGGRVSTGGNIETQI